MDGTIVDTTGIWTQATKELLKSKGVVVTPKLQKEIESMIHGLALDKTCAVIKDIIKLDEPIEQLIMQKSRIACDLYKTGITFIKGFEDFHAQVVMRNLKNGIATNADNATFKITKDVLNLERFFGEHTYNIACVDYICKPDPAIYLYTAKKLDVKPEECIAIEDSAHGVKAAKRAGMYCIGINTAGDLEQLKEADHIIQGYNDLNLDLLIK